MTIDDALNLARQHHSAGQLQQAEQIYRQILQQAPNHADALHLLGVMALQLGATGQSIELISRAIAINPNDAAYHSNLAEAQRIAGNLAAAEMSCRRALQLDPNFPAGLGNLGTILLEQSKLDEAEQVIRRALELAPDMPAAVATLVAILQSQGRLDEAIEFGRRALSIAPDHPNIHNNLAKALDARGLADEAETHSRRAVDLNPANPDLLSNLASALRYRGQLPQAVQWWEKAVSVAPNHKAANWNLALAYLSLGDFARGWPLYARRFEFGRSLEFPREYPEPHWTGQDIAGRTILLYPEQGYGDVIMFSRYAGVLARRGARVLMHMPADMVGLMKHVQGVAEVLGPDDPLPAFDTHQALLTLPTVLGTTLETIPSEIPYIRVDSDRRERFARRMTAPAGNMKVGLVWSGRATHVDDAIRSIPLRMLESLLQLPRISFFSLQKGDAAKQLADSSSPIVDLNEDLNDFCDTAAALANLDLLISVDTAPAHLAGAIGTRVWTLLPFTPDFRWMLDREDSPWYPTLRLFRQRHRNDWAEVIERVRQELSNASVHRH